MTQRRQSQIIIEDLERADKKFDFRVETEELQIQKNNKNQFEILVLKNFLFFAFITVCAITLRSFLHKFVSLVGSFVGIFEVSIFPMSMIISMERKKEVLGQTKLWLLVSMGILFSILGISSFVVTLFF